MKRIVWDNQAIDDLIGVADFIAQDSPRAAAKVVAYIRNAANLLETSP